MAVSNQLAISFLFIFNFNIRFLVKMGMCLIPHITLSRGSTAMYLLLYSYLLPQLHSVLWVGGASCLYTLTNSRLNKWEVEDGYEQQILSWDVQKALNESITDAIWVSSNMQETSLLP